MELLTLLLNLVLGILEAGLSASSLPLLYRQLCGQLLVLLLCCTQGLVGLDSKVSLDPSFVAGVFPHSSATNTSWMAYAKTTREFYVKRKMRGEKDNLTQQPSMTKSLPRPSPSSGTEKDPTASWFVVQPYLWVAVGAAPRPQPGSGHSLSRTP